MFQLRYIIMALLTLTSLEAVAQKFRVEGFRQLPNDVSAFIEPVKDLNDEDCALIKVMAGPDYVFSSPLGIIKRVDNTGEIWIYLPRKSKTLTIKHPRLGVMRDYRFPLKIDSHLTYELRLEEPASAQAIREVPVKVVTTVRDTLVVTRTDTLVITPERKVYPLTFMAGGGVTVGGNQMTVAPGVMIGVMKRIGGYVSVASDFGRVGETLGQCDRDGAIGEHKPFYSGKKRHSFLMVNAGLMHRLSRRVTVFEGAGYGYNEEAWQLARSEGGGYVKNAHYCHKGLTFQVGSMISFGRWALGAAVSTVKGRRWYGSLGICYCFTRKSGNNEI